MTAENVNYLRPDFYKTTVLLGVETGYDGFDSYYVKRNGTFA